MIDNGLKVATFKERFNKLFDESGKTITALAQDLHVSNQTISAWKTGARSPKEPTIISIAEYFGVQVHWLMGFDVEKDKAIAEMHNSIYREDAIREEREKIADLYMSLSENNREAAKKYMEYLKSMEVKS